MIGRGHLGAGLCQGGGGPPKGLCLEGGSLFGEIPKSSPKYLLGDPQTILRWSVCFHWISIPISGKHSQTLLYFVQMF